MEKEFERIQNENEELKSSLKQSNEKYYAASEDLIKQQTVNSEQKMTIKMLTKKLHSLEKSLRNAFHDIQKLEVSLGKAQNNTVQKEKEEERPSQNNQMMNPIDQVRQSLPNLEVPLQQGSKAGSLDDEINKKLEEFMKTSTIPLKFIRIGEGIYTFGSKKVHIKILNGRLIVRIGGGYMPIEQFVQSYGANELAKMKQCKENEVKYTDLDEEEIQQDQKLMVYPNNEKEALAKENGVGEITQALGLGKPSPKPRKIERLHTYSQQSPENKLIAPVSQRSARNLDSRKSSTGSSTFRFEGENQSATAGAETEHTLKTCESGSRTERRPKTLSSALSPSSQKTLSREGSLTRPAFTDASNIKREKSPSNKTSTKSRNTPTNNTREISPFNKAPAPKGAKTKEFPPNTITAVNKP